MAQQELQILLVDDNPNDVEMTMRALRKDNFVSGIAVARDGEAALDFLFCRGEFSSRSFDHPPRLVLLDLKLPKVDGLEVLRAVKGDPRTHAIPIVVLTSSCEENDVVESYDLGVNAYIQKPMGFEAFRDYLKQLRLFWLEINESPPPSSYRA